MEYWGFSKKYKILQPFGSVYLSFTGSYCVLLGGDEIKLLYEVSAAVTTTTWSGENEVLYDTSQVILRPTVKAYAQHNQL